MTRITYMCLHWSIERSGKGWDLRGLYHIWSIEVVESSSCFKNFLKRKPSWRIKEKEENRPIYQIWYYYFNQLINLPLTRPMKKLFLHVCGGRGTWTEPVISWLPDISGTWSFSIHYFSRKYQVYLLAGKRHLLLSSLALVPEIKQLDKKKWSWARN